MRMSEYLAMFSQMGLYCQDRQGIAHPVSTAQEAGRSLRHPNAELPVIYIDESVANGVYFVVRSDQRSRFRDDLWDEAPLRRASDPPTYAGMIPKTGLEGAAFVSLL